jgi:hypothetical protein
MRTVPAVANLACEAHAAVAKRFGPDTLAIGASALTRTGHGAACADSGTATTKANSRAVTRMVCTVRTDVLQVILIPLDRARKGPARTSVDATPAWSFCMRMA